MKKCFSFLLCLCLMLPLAAMGQEELMPIQNPADIQGVWTSCGGTSSVGYLVIHADGSFEMYDYWELLADAQQSAFMARGEITQEEETGMYSLSNGVTDFRLQTCVLDDERLSSDEWTTAKVGSTALFLDDFRCENEEWSASQLMLRVPDDHEALGIWPDAAALCAPENGWRIGSGPMENIVFKNDGTAVYLFDGQEHSAAYEIDHGRLLLTENGQTRTLLLSYLLFRFEDQEIPEDQSYGKQRPAQIDYDCINVEELADEWISYQFESTDSNGAG